MPSVLDLLGINVEDRLLVGQSVFDKNKPGHAYNYSAASYWFMGPKVLVDLGREPAPLRTYTHEHSFNRVERPNSGPEFTDDIANIKAVVHYLNEGLVGNSLYKWRASL
jgi:hypothetical protein